MKRVAARPAILGIVASVLIFAAWYQMLWTPGSKAIASAHGREQTATAALFTAEQRLGHLKKLATHAPQLARLDLSLSSAIPGSDSIDGFIVDLNSEAQAANVTISSLAITPPGASKAATAGVQTIGLQMQIGGGYFDVQRFLGAVRDGSRLVTIDQLAISSGAAKTPGNGSTIAATILGRLFVSSTATTALNFGAPAAPAARAAPAKSGTGVLETPINAARNAAISANAAQAGGTP